MKELEALDILEQAITDAFKNGVYNMKQAKAVLDSFEIIKSKIITPLPSENKIHKKEEGSN